MVLTVTDRPEPERRKPLVLPSNFRDVTAERIGTVSGVKRLWYARSPASQRQTWFTMMGLELAYCRARDIIGQERAECLDAAVEVDRLRLAYRPECVRVVVLAESHVWTSRDEIRSRVVMPNGIETGFVRFVYCLGYGEPQLVVPAVTPNRRGVSNQFWRLFHDTVYGPTIPHARVMGGEADSQKRVQNKLDLLEKMRSAGIWLVDASVTALYPKGALTSRDVRTVLRACWESYIGEVVCQCAPSAVLIVGKGVQDAVGEVVRQDLGHGVEVAVINQPNAHISAEAIASDRCVCFALCCRPRP
jgi:hypothetical protein